MTDLREWLAWLESLHPKPIDMGLDRVAQVAQRMFTQPLSARIITVGGTNGKGSTCAFLESILLQSGYRVGLYTSPHLLRYNERVRIDGVPVTDAQLVTAFAAVEQVRGNVSLTYFEFGTLAAMWLFRAEPMDVLVLEVGLGGRLDAVNVFDPDCAVLTSVALDHMDYLGATREAIGREKAGIFRRNQPAVYGERSPPKTVLEHAQLVGASWFALGEAYDFEVHEKTWDYCGVRTLKALPKPVLAGAHQIQNAAAALAALEALAAALPVDTAAIHRGLTRLALPARFQCLPGLPQRILDVAHNPHGAAVLAQTLSQEPVAGRTYAVVGMLADKDIAGVFAALLDVVDVWLPVGLDVPRGADAALLQQLLLEQGVDAVQCHATPLAAWQTACEEALDCDRIVAFGSFHTIAALMQGLGDCRT